MAQAGTVSGVRLAMVEMSTPDTTKQAKSGGGHFHGVALYNGADANIAVYDGTANIDALIWAGHYDSTSAGFVNPPTPVPFAKGCFVETSAALTKGVVMVS